MCSKRCLSVWNEKCSCRYNWWHTATRRDAVWDSTGNAPHYNSILHVTSRCMLEWPPPVGTEYTGKGEDGFNPHPLRKHLYDRTTLYNWELLHWAHWIKTYWLVTYSHTIHGHRMQGKKHFTSVVHTGSVPHNWRTWTPKYNDLSSHVFSFLHTSLTLVHTHLSLQGISSTFPKS